MHMLALLGWYLILNSLFWTSSFWAFMCGAVCLLPSIGRWLESSDFYSSEDTYFDYLNPTGEYDKEPDK
jgi:polyferredoxin